MAVGKLLIVNVKMGLNKFQLLATIKLKSSGNTNTATKLA